MNDEAQLKLMAFVDGELSANEAAKIEAMLKTDRAAADLVDELRWSAQAIVGNELELKVPERREFYWSKISKAIEFQEKQAERAESRPSAQWWYKFLMPVAGLAAVVLAFNFVMPNQPADTTGTGADEGSIAFTAPLENIQADVSIYEFYDERENMSVVWVTPGAETEFTNPQRDPLNQDDQF